MKQSIRNNVIFVAVLVLVALLAWRFGSLTKGKVATARERLDEKVRGSYRVWVERQTLYHPITDSLKVYLANRRSNGDTGTVIYAAEGYPDYARLGIVSENAIELLAGSDGRAFTCELSVKGAPLRSYLQKPPKRDTTVAPDRLWNFGEDSARVRALFGLNTSPRGKVPFCCYVPDSTTAIRIAEIVLEARFGAYARDLRPYHAMLRGDSLWVVIGYTRGPMVVGGGATAWIRKSDGKILEAVLGE